MYWDLEGSKGGERMKRNKYNGAKCTDIKRRFSAKANRLVKCIGMQWIKYKPKKYTSYANHKNPMCYDLIPAAKGTGPQLCNMCELSIIQLSATL
jgi:hypothetical protein